MTQERIEKFYGTYKDAEKRVEELRKKFPNSKINLHVPVISAHNDEYNITKTLSSKNNNFDVKKAVTKKFSRDSSKAFFEAYAQHKGIPVYLAHKVIDGRYKPYLSALDDRTYEGGIYDAKYYALDEAIKKFGIQRTISELAKIQRFNRKPKKQRMLPGERAWEETMKAETDVYDFRNRRDDK